MDLGGGSWSRQPVASQAWTIVDTVVPELTRETLMGTAVAGTAASQGAMPMDVDSCEAVDAQAAVSGSGGHRLHAARGLHEWLGALSCHLEGECSWT